MSSLARKHNALNLGQGFPNFDCSEELKAIVKRHLGEAKNQYAPMPGVQQLREILSQKVESQYAQILNPDTEVTITAGATQAIYTIISAFVKQDDEVIIIEPAYDSYRPTIEINGGRAVAYELRGPDYRIDWEEFRKLINDRTRMIIFNNPHNPMGMIYSHEDLLELQSSVSARNIIVLSDEVYEHLVFDEKKHCSVLAYPELFRQSFAVFSFGKTFHVTGWKIGYCMACEELMKEFRRLHQWNVFSVNSFLQYALAEYLEDKNNYLSLPAFYQNKRDIFAKAMQKTRFKALKSEGSYFQLYDYSEISEKTDTEFAEMLVREFGVASIPISVFYGSGRQEKLIRFCFAKTEDLLIEAAHKLELV